MVWIDDRYTPPFKLKPFVNEGPTFPDWDRFPETYPLPSGTSTTPAKRRIYLVGSLRNPLVVEVAEELRRAGHEVFDDWMAAGPEADDSWQKYEQQRGRGYVEALGMPAAEHVFEFDVKWLNWADTVILIRPCGIDAHTELAWAAGKGKETHLVLDKEPERWGVMVKFHKVWYSVEDLVDHLG